MTLFWIICALLLVVALLFIVLPLWRAKGSDKQVVRDAANLDIFRDQLAEMGADLNNGLITPELYEQGKHELQARLLEEVQDPVDGGRTAARSPHKALALVLVVLLPLLALGLYWKLGNPHALLPQSTESTQATQATQASGPGTMDLTTAVKELEGKIAENPKDVDSLFLLGRAYAAMERFPDAVKVYEQLTAMLPKEAQLWADYADVLAMQNGRELAGRPTEMIHKALKLDPKNAKALAMAGTAAMMAGEYPDAIRHWEGLIKVLPPGSEEVSMVEKGIQEARKRMGGAPAMQASPAAPAPALAPGQERISGSVTLSAALQGKAKPDDFLFVLARAAEGPKMPLAVMRKQVKDLPLQFTLDDSMAMAPQMKLSKFDKVVVVARISASGDPLAHPGDMEAVSEPVQPGSSGIKLNIDSIVK